MDSPFNQGFRRDQSPASPQTPGGSNAYQVNVNRTKTRKWVEAKVQNYDGDDWGADEYDEDDEPEPEPTPPVPPAKHDAALPSTQPAHDAAVPSTTGHLPALQTQPAAAAAVPSIQQTRPAGVTSPVVSDPSTLGSPVDRDRVVSPQSTIAAASIASNSQPPEAALPLAEKTSVVQSFDVHAPLVEAKTEEPTPADAGHSAEAHPSDRNRPDGTSVESQTKDGVGAAEHGEDDRRRFSVSPKLPDVGRMSAFGTDLFSPGESGFLAEPTVTEPEKDNDVSSLASPTCLAQYDAEPTKAAVPASPPVPETTPTILAEPVQAPVEQQPVTVSEDSAGGKSPVASVERHSSAKSAAGSATKASVDETAAHSVSQPREPSSEKFQELPTVVAPTTLGNAQPDAEFDGNPLLRQSTLSTVNESPVKDNDALSEEILRSLSPTRSGPADAALGDSSKLQPGDRSAARESSYTLQDYDSYWADTSKPEPIPEREPPAEAGSSVPGNTTSPTAPPEAAKAEVQATSPREPELRRKFSWEAEEAVPPPASAPAAEATRSPVATTAGAGDEMSAAEVSRTQEAPPGLIPISAQQPAAVEPPSPVSTSDEPLRHSKRVSLMDDNALAETAPTPPPESHPPTADVAATPYSAPPQQQAQVMPFREIMGLSSSADRINKYNESRDYFVTSDSGLDSWLVTLKDQHPEYANGAVPYGAAPAGRQPTPGSSNASPVGTQPPSQQQPYYQQYLNASSPTAGPSPTSRSRLGGLQMPSSQGSGSAFGHSGNQIGTKSKEFMHSAGKMGKGLLSKGKSKLRASGDKDEASPAAAPAPAAGEQQPPPPQPKPKGEKRMSWGLGLAARSRPDGTAPPADSGPDSGSNTGSHTDNASTVAPQIPQPTPMSPLSSSSHQPGPTPPWGAAGPGQPPSQPPPSMGHGQHHPVQSPRPGGPGSRATAGLSKLEIPGGVQPTTGASARGWPVGGGQSAAAKPTQPEQLAAEGRASDDWVIVPRDSGDHPIGFAALQDATVTAPPVARPIPQDSGVALQSEPPANDPGPQRKSSFIGLPPIRRTSTFGLTTKAKRASERFSLDDDDDDDAQAAAGVGGVPPAGHPVDLDKSLPPAPIDQEAAPAGASPQVRTRVSAADGEAADGTGTQRTQGTDTQRTLVDTNATGPQAQKDDAQLQEPHAPHSAPRQASQQTMAPPKSPMMTKAQQMFPQGNWSLEESHLAEPLHERTRNRSGTGGSQHTPAFGFDKETGVMMPPQRQRTSDVPPSSAQRWPELFQRRPDYDAQRPRANSGAGRPYPQQYQHQMVRGEAVNPRPQISEFAIAGVGPPAEEEDRGRSKRNSGIFRGIGDRISRTASKERRPSLAAQPQSSEVRGDEVSENSVATSELQEPKKRRPSFMFGRSGRTSMDQSSLRNESINGPDHVGMRGPDTPPPQAERRRSLFGMGAGGKAAVPAPGQSPTSSVANDSSSAIAANTEEAAPKKKRFSNLAKVGGIKDIFHRPGNNDKAKESNAEGPTPGSHPHGPGAMAPPPAPFHGRARSSTANSHDLPLPQPVVAQEGLEGRGRRGSASNLFAAFTGRGSASKTRQQGDAPGHNQPVLHQQPDHSSHGTSRWKGLKNRVSGQMAHSGPQHHQKQEKGEKGDRLSGSKLLGAFKRGSKQPDPGHQAGPQSQQPNVPAQPGQFQQRPAQAQPMGAPARSPAQPGVANVSGPQQVPQQRHVSMPAQQLPQQPVQQQPVQQRHSAPQQEPVYDQVPIPQGYSTVRGEGTVAPSPYNIPRHMAQGQFHQLQPQSPEMGSSPGLGSSPSPPSTVDRRGSAGISDVLAHQPSANSIAPNHTRADDAATKSQQGYLQPNAGGHNPSGPRSHSSDGSHVSADEATVSQQSRSPEPSVTDKSVSRNNNLGIDVDKAKKLTEDNIYDATPRLNNNSGGGSHKQRPAKLSRAVSGETIDSQGEVKEHAVVVHDGDDGDNEGPTAELDDTADRYERSRRLESQEEKILYKPEDQEDFLPQMSATSYPGQEWNPYGEPGFGEWKDDSDGVDVTKEMTVAPERTKLAAVVAPLARTEFNAADMTTDDEETPLLPAAQQQQQQQQQGINGINGKAAHAGKTSKLRRRPDRKLNPTAKTPWTTSFAAWMRRVFNVERRILFAGFLITLAFSYTQVPLFYVFHLMECDTFYDSHPPYNGTGDRCSRDEIAAGTATQFSILGMSTTLCGTLNLFVAGWVVKKFGPRAALMAQTFVPAVRVATQIIGVVAGKRAGMIIIQCTQLITILGGPAGYILVVNIIAGEVVEPSRRTAVFGMLQGCIMLGQGIGYLTGGMIGDAIDIRAPFDVAFVSFLVAGVYARLALPYIAPHDMSDGKKPGQQGVSGFLAPLRILAPQRLRRADGRVSKHYGVIFLCAGIFLGVLATGYAPLLIQMYATAAFEFNQADNGWLMSEFAFMRSFFLILLFPRIISWGRSLTLARAASSSSLAEQVSDDETSTLLPTEPGQFDATAGEQVEDEPITLAKSGAGRDGCLFDLVFLRWSLVVDGALTTVVAFATQRWHIYLAAFLLPFGSGSAPAAKGVITEMCPESQRADALNAVTLVENIARLATQGLFGFVFASLAEVGKAYATFFCNAAVAVIGMGVLLFSNFPPPDSTLVEDLGAGEDSNEGES
ncbi:Chromosome segregation in meiosis protein 3 [Purpureocillium lavendulum]|uniref:Chromosome segregation in meiosis protein 3 n=1 Tax=Purpureocillium lavendulum TaxID=1247861 RepID=A0AB34FVD9_9HYPO|nr:Chromosome segregation in meiosis protein 3 [Purpureocillium lavendulum]